MVRSILHHHGESEGLFTQTPSVCCQDRSHQHSVYRTIRVKVKDYSHTKCLLSEQKSTLSILKNQGESEGLLTQTQSVCCQDRSHQHSVYRTIRVKVKDYSHTKCLLSEQKSTLSILKNQGESEGLLTQTQSVCCQDRSHQHSVYRTIRVKVKDYSRTKCLLSEQKSTLSILKNQGESEGLLTQTQSVCCQDRSHQHSVYQTIRVKVKDYSHTKCLLSEQKSTLSILNNQGESEGLLTHKVFVVRTEVNTQYTEKSGWKWRTTHADTKCLLSGQKSSTLSISNNQGESEGLLTHKVFVVRTEVNTQYTEKSGWKWRTTHADTKCLLLGQKSSTLSISNNQGESEGLLTHKVFVVRTEVNTQYTEQSGWKWRTTHADTKWVLSGQKSTLRTQEPWPDSVPARLACCLKKKEKHTFLWTSGNRVVKWRCLCWPQGQSRFKPYFGSRLVGTGN